MDAFTSNARSMVCAPTGVEVSGILLGAESIVVGDVAAFGARFAAVAIASVTVNDDVGCTCTPIDRLVVQ